MNTIIKDFKKWYEALTDDEKLKFNDDLEFLYNIAYQWNNKISEKCSKSGVDDPLININKTLLKQALVDAYDDLKRLKNYHMSTETTMESNPNLIKEMAYYTYWIVRKKPLTFLNEDILSDENLTEMQRTKILFCNEHYAVQLIFTAMFPGQKVACTIMEKLGSDQLKCLKKYMLYYLTYRLDSPKSLEAIMLSSTVHPIYEVHKMVWLGNNKQFEEKYI